MRRSHLFRKYTDSVFLSTSTPRTKLLLQWTMVRPVKPATYTIRKRVLECTVQHITALSLLFTLRWMGDLIQGRALVSFGSIFHRPASSRVIVDGGKLIAIELITVVVLNEAMKLFFLAVSRETFAHKFNGTSSDQWISCVPWVRPVAGLARGSALHKHTYTHRDGRKIEKHKCTKCLPRSFCGWLWTSRKFLRPTKWVSYTLKALPGGGQERTRATRHSSEAVFPSSFFC